MDKPQYDYHDLNTSYFSFGDILAIGLMLATGLYFIITSALRIGALVFGIMDTLDLMTSIISAVVGYGLIYSAYKFVKRSANLKAIADSIFVETLYERLEPLLADISETKVSYDMLSEKIDSLNYNVNDIRKSIELGKNVSSGDIVPLQYAIRNIKHQFQNTMLTTFTLAMYMFMFYNPSDIVPYLSPVIYILWWALITSQHDLWEVPKAWYWVAVPILFIPMYTILFTALYTANIMLLVMYIGLGAYVLSYYIWSEYTARGIFPFGIGERIHNIKTMLKKPEVPREKPEVNKPAMRPGYIGSIMIILAILVFAFSILGYLIENKLISISWQTLGLDIAWQPLYLYGLTALGALLLVIGSIFVVRFRKYR